MIDREFFELFGREQFVWQTFSDAAYKKANSIKNNGKIQDGVAKVLRGTIDSVESGLISYQSKGAGVFFQPNEGGRGSKAITKVNALWLDLDDAPIAPVLASVKSQDTPAPNAIVQSSPGKFHVYWLVSECEKQVFKRAQKVLAARFGGDPKVCNLDRVMRVPGSVNYKTLEGFQTKCKVLHKNTVPYYMLVDIAEITQSVGDIAKSLDDYDGLIEDDKGYDVDQITSGNRTEALISEAGRFVATMPECRPSDVMAHLRAWEKEKLRKGDALKTEESWENEIYPGVLRFIEERDAQERKRTDAHLSRVEEIRQVDEDAAEDWKKAIDSRTITYDEFTQRFVYCSSEDTVYDLEKPAHAKPWKLSQFKTWSCCYKQSDRKGSIATRWLHDKRGRVTVHCSTFVPKAYSTELAVKTRVTTCPLTGVVAYNTYQQPQLVPSKVCDESKVAVVLDHLKYLCNNDEFTYNELLNWLAFTIQVPEQRIPVVPLIISKFGVGKGWLYECLQKVMGEWNVNSLQNVSKFDANNQFNGFLVDCKLVVIHETKGSRKSVEALKSLITEKSLDINIKYGAQTKKYIYANMMFFSNHDDAMPLDQGDRRYWVIRHMGEVNSTAYYDKLFQWLETDGPSNFFRFLLDRDLSAYEFAKHAPMTQAKAAMIRNAKHEDEQVLADAIEDRLGVFALDLIPAGCLVGFVEQLRGEPFAPGDRRGFLHRAYTYARAVHTVCVNGKRETLYAVRNLEKYREGVLTREAAREAHRKAWELYTSTNKMRQVR